MARQINKSRAAWHGWPASCTVSCRLPYLALPFCRKEHYSFQQAADSIIRPCRPSCMSFFRKDDVHRAQGTVWHQQDTSLRFKHIAGCAIPYSPAGSQTAQALMKTAKCLAEQCTCRTGLPRSHQNGTSSSSSLVNSGAGAFVPLPAGLAGVAAPPAGMPMSSGGNGSATSAKPAPAAPAAAAAAGAP